MDVSSIDFWWSSVLKVLKKSPHIRFFNLLSLLFKNKKERKKEALMQCLVNMALIKKSKKFCTSTTKYVSNPQITPKWGKALEEKWADKMWFVCGRNPQHHDWNMQMTRVMSKQAAPAEIQSLKPDCCAQHWVNMPPIIRKNKSQDKCLIKENVLLLEPMYAYALSTSL